ncbi:MAG: hypothetical protein HY356_07830 [Gammaproteobacteria bacterium]|nr:hypothetical protein [Gammaproteobacteria bacterium]
MTSDLIYFNWHVPKNRHKWINGLSIDLKTGELGKQEFYLAPEPGGHRRYMPLSEYPGLYKDFAVLTTDQKQIMDFANKYGLLGGNLREMIIMKEKRSRYIGESFNKWKMQIIRLKEAVLLHDMIRNNNIKGLSDLIAWGDSCIKYKSKLNIKRNLKKLKKTETIPIYEQLIASRPPGVEHHSYLFSLIPHGDVLAPAKIYLQTIVNQQLSSETSARIILSPDFQESKLRIEPNSLLGAIWLQFARVINGQKEPIRCICNTWFIPKRPDQTHCMRKCRQRAYENRKVNRGKSHERSY